MTTPDAGQRLIEDLRSMPHLDDDNHRLANEAADYIESADRRWQLHRGDCTSLNNEIDGLMAEIERLRGVEDANTKLNDCIVQLQFEVDSATADALRYRFLRECSPTRSDVSIHVQEGIYKDGYYIRDSWPSGDDLDARLDELIAASRSTGAANVGERS